MDKCRLAVSFTVIMDAQTQINSLKQDQVINAFYCSACLDGMCPAGYQCDTTTNMCCLGTSTAGGGFDCKKWAFPRLNKLRISISNICTEQFLNVWTREIRLWSNNITYYRKFIFIHKHLHMTSIWRMNVVECLFFIQSTEPIYANQGSQQKQGGTLRIAQFPSP